MANLMNFEARVREVFENDSAKLFAFNKLMLDTYNGTLEADINVKEANKQIVSMFKQIIGVDDNATKAQIRKAIQRNQQVLFDLIEEVVPNLLQTGWQENPFFNEFVEIRNLDIGDQAMFYSDDETLLTVSKVSGNHWDLDRQRLGKGSSFTVATSWYGIASMLFLGRASSLSRRDGLEASPSPVRASSGAKAKPLVVIPRAKVSVLPGISLTKL